MNNNNDTESKEKKFYVYIHFKKDSLEPFYIGKGTGNRYQSSHGRNRYWNNIANKYGFVPDILKYFENEQDAFDYEKEMILFFKSEGYKLCNMTEGGEGASGFQHSQEARAKMSAAQKGVSKPPLNPETRAKLSAAMKGKTHKPHSPETRAKMSAAKSGKSHSTETRAKMSAAQKGRTPSPETRAKLSAARVGKKRSDELRAKLIKIIIAINLSTGEVFKITGGHLEMKSLGFNPSHVSACVNGKRSRHKGHSFSFKDAEQHGA